MNNEIEYQKKCPFTVSGNCNIAEQVRKWEQLPEGQEKNVQKHGIGPACDDCPFLSSIRPS